MPFDFMGAAVPEETEYYYVTSTDHYILNIINCLRVTILII